MFSIAHYDAPRPHNLVCACRINPYTSIFHLQIVEGIWDIMGVFDDPELYYVSDIRPLSLNQVKISDSQTILRLFQENVNDSSRG